MQLENETNVAKEATSETTAQNAEKPAAGELVPAGPGAATPSSSETTVSPELEAKILAIAESAIKQSLFAMQDQLPQAIADYFAANPVRQVVTVTPEVQQAIEMLVDVQVDNAKADILRQISRAGIAAAPAPEIVVHHGEHPSLDVGNPVKVWADPEHKTFFTGEIVAVHDAGHAFDVKLDTNGAVSKIGADGLEFDDRK